MTDASSKLLILDTCGWTRQRRFETRAKRNIPIVDPKIRIFQVDMGREGLTLRKSKERKPCKRIEKKKEELLQLWNIYCSHVMLLFTHFNSKFVKKITFNFKRKSSMILLSINRGIIYWIIQNNRLNVYSRRQYTIASHYCNSYAHFSFISFSLLSIIFVLIFETATMRGKVN